MAINAGNVVAYLTLDSSGFSSAMQRAEGQLGSFAQGSGGLSGALDTMGRKMQVLGSALTLGVTVPLVGAGLQALNTGKQFDAGMSRVGAISGATAEDMERLRQAAIDMGASSAFGASDAAKAMEYMGMAGWNATQMIDGLPGIMDLAAASGEDLGTVSDIVTDALTAFGLKASDSAHFADVLATATTKSNTNVAMLGESFKYVAPLAGSLGYTAEDVSVALGLMANAGIKGSQSGTALRSTLTRLTKPTKEVQKAMKKYGISLKDSKGNMLPLSQVMVSLREKFSGLSEAQKATLAATLAGQEGMSGLLAIVNASDEDFDSLTGAVNDCAGATQKMASGMLDNLSGDITMFKSAMEGVALSFSTWITPIVRKAVQFVTNLVSKFNALSSSSKKIVLGAATALAGLGPVLTVGGKLLSTFGIMGPIVLALGAGFKLLYNHSARFRDAVDGIKNKLTSFTTRVSKTISTFTNLRDMGYSVSDAFALAFGHFWGEEKLGKIQKFLSTLTGGFEVVKQRVSAVADGIGAFTDALLSGQGLTEAIGQGLTQAFGEETTHKVAGFVQNMSANFSALKQAWQQDGIIGVIGKLGEALKSGFKKAASHAVSGAKALRTKITTGLQMGYEFLKPHVTKWLTTLGNAFRNLKDKVTDKLPAVREAIVNGLSAGKLALTNKARQAMIWLGQAYRSPQVQTLLGDLSTVGQNILGKITAGKEWLTAKAGEMLTGLATALGSEEVKAKVGEITSVAATIAGKVTSNMGAWKVTAMQMIGDLVAQLTDNGFLSETITGLGSIVTAIADGLITSATNITTAAATLISTLLDKFSEEGFISTLFTTAASVAESIISSICSAAVDIGASASALMGSLITALGSIDWATVFTTEGDIASSIIDKICSATLDLSTQALGLMSKLVTALGSLDWTSLAASVTKVAKTLLTKIVDAIPALTVQLSNLVKAIATGMSTIDWAGMGQVLKTFATDLIDNLIDNLPSMATAATDIVNALATAIGSAAEALAAMAGQLVGGLVRYVLTPENWAKLMQLGASILSAIKSGVLNLGGTIIESTANTMSSLLVNTVRGAFGIEVDAALEERVQDIFDNVYTVMNAQGEPMQMSGAALMGYLSSSLMTTDDITIAMQAWKVAMDEGITGAFSDASYLGNQAVMGLLAILADEDGDKAERIKAAAILMGSEYGDGLENGIYTTYPDIAEAAASMMDGVNEEVDAATAALGSALPGAISDGIDAGIPILEKASGKVAAIANGTQDKVTTLSDAVEVGEDSVSSIAEGEKNEQETVESASEGISTAIVDSYTDMPGLLTEMGKNGITGMAEGITTTQSSVETASDTVSDAAVKAFVQNMSRDTGRQVGVEYGQGVCAGLGAEVAMLKITATFAGAAGHQALANAMSSANGYNIGKNIIDGVIAGIRLNTKSLVSAMRTMAQKAVRAAKDELDIHSPSRVFAGLGRMIPAGMAVGISGNEQTALSAVVRMAGDMQRVFDMQPGMVQTVQSAAQTQRDAAARTSSTQGGLTQNITINSPKAVNAYEVARQLRQVDRELALRM